MNWKPVLMGLGTLLMAAPATGEHRGVPLDEWFPRLRAGMWVKVEGYPEAGRLRATEIQVVDGDLDEWEIEGWVDSVDVATRTLRMRLGIDVVATGRTELQDRRKKPMSFSNLVGGIRIQTEGQLQKDGTLLADEIEMQKIKNEDETEEDELAGRIEAVDAKNKSIVVLGITIQVDDRTKNKTTLLE